MDIVEIIEKKKDKLELTKEEIDYVVKNYTEGSIKDYQMSSLLMAIVLNGMTNEETNYLTESMLNSGDKIDLSNINGVVVDKHSTGGVGDKVSLIALPLAASCGVKIAKMSGRGLGHTGGTVDKLESIPGFKISLSNEEFIKQVNEIGMSLVSQTKNLVPADKKIYALRDVTGTVASLPLIASSIMSKKIASGAKALVLDVKVGSGAFMKNKEDASSLAKLMVSIAKSFGIKAVAVLSNMDEPLGLNIGNSLEVVEAIEVLKNKGEEKLTALSVELSSYMVSLSNNISYEEAKEKVLEALENGSAYAKFEEFVSCQGGDLSLLKISLNKVTIKTSKTGYINDIEALGLGKLAMKLGAGRHTKEDEIDYSVGLKLHHKVGDFVNMGDDLITLYRKDSDTNTYEDDVEKAFVIEETKKDVKPLIYEVID